MKKELYMVTTTFFGADAQSFVFYDTAKKAEHFLAKQSNGEIEKVCVINQEDDVPIFYKDGCTINDLSYGGMYPIKIDAMAEDQA